MASHVENGVRRRDVVVDVVVHLQVRVEVYDCDSMDKASRAAEDRASVAVERMFESRAADRMGLVDGSVRTRRHALRLDY